MTNNQDASTIIFREVCEAVNAYLAKNLPDVERTVEEIEALVMVQYAAMCEHYEIEGGRECFVKNARSRLAVPVAQRTAVPADHHIGRLPLSKES